MKQNISVPNLPHPVKPGDVAFVTGASRGIGRGIAVALAKQGCKLALLATTGPSLEATKQQCLSVSKALKPQDIICIVADVSDADAVKSAVERCVAELGDLTVLINCAGINRRRSALEADPKVWSRLIDINLKGSMNTTAYALSHMRKTCFGMKRGVIIFIGSIVSKFKGAPGICSYVASKQGLQGFAQSALLDIVAAGLNVKICCINADLVNTELGVKPPGGRGQVVSPELMIQVDDISNAVMFVLSANNTVVPSTIDLDNVRFRNHYIKRNSNL